MNRTCSRYAVAAALAAGLCAASAPTALAQAGSDACSAGAPAIFVGTPVTSDTLTATTDFSITPAATCGGFTGSGGGLDVFYTFTPPATGSYAFALCGSEFDTVLAVMTACDGAAANVVACNDDAAPSCGVNNESRINSVALTGGVAYIVRVAGYGDTAPASGAFTLAVATAAPPPANDDCASAGSFAIPGAGGTVNGSCADATRDGEATCDEDDFTAVDVYYSFTPGTNGPWQLALCGTAVPWDTVISVHASGCPVNDTVGAGPGNQVDTTANSGCADDGCSATNRLSIIPSLPLVAGTLYTIRVAPLSSDVDLWGDGVIPQPFSLTVTDIGGVPPPANDSCSAPTIIPIAPLPVALAGDSTAATASPAGDGVLTASCSFNTTDSKDVWFSFSPGVTATYTIDTAGSAIVDTVLSIYSGSCASPVEVDCNDDISIADLHSRTSAALTAGVNYLIRVAGLGNAVGAYALNVSAPVPPPVNDTCATATVVSSLPFADAPDNTGAGNDPDVDCNADDASATNRGVWYTFTASSDCTLVVNQAGTQDTVTAVFTGTCDALVNLECTDPEPLVVATTTGTQYFILVGRWTATSPPGGFTIAVNIDCQVPPANDQCATPATLPLSSATPGAFSPVITGDAVTDCSGTDADLWYAMTATTAGAYLVTSTPGGPAEPAVALAVFSACPTGVGQEIACVSVPAAGSSTGVLFVAQAATTYLVRVATFSADTTTFNLLAEQVIPQACCDTVTGACALLVSSDTCPSGTASQGPGTTCTPGICGVTGACCAADFSCSVTLEVGCTGTWTAGGVCAPVNPCLPAAPANDLCANATALSAFPFSDSVQTVGATNDGPIAPQGDCNYGGDNEGVVNSVWYRFAPASNGTLGYTINPDVVSPGYDAILIIYSGADCTGLAEVACNEEPEPITGSQPVSSGSVYYLCIGDWGAFEGGGETAVSFTFTPDVPTTDNCCRGTTCNPVTAGTCTGQVAGSNSLVVTSCGAGSAFASCCYADFNHDGAQSIDDLFLYINAYFTSSPMSDFGGDGTSQPTIDDLFLYINAYFGTCS